LDTKEVARQYRLEKWSALITERQNSGLNVREFCKERNIKEHIYYYWLKRIREAACNSMPTVSVPVFAPVTFSEANVPDQSAKLTLNYAGISLDVYESTSPDLLKNTLLLLKQVLPQGQRGRVFFVNKVLYCEKGRNQYGKKS
jgi:hypothetical protein